jgi:hypothetical protein
MPEKQYNLVKAALDAVREHPSLGPKVTKRWITDDRLHKLVMQQLGSSNSPLKDTNMTRQKLNRSLGRNPDFKNEIGRQQNTVGLFRLEFNKELYYWLGGEPKFPRPPTELWRNKILEADKQPLETTEDTVDNNADESCNDKPPPAKRQRPRVYDLQQTYWDSPEALKLFRPAEDDDTVIACMERRIELLALVNRTCEGYRLVIDDDDYLKCSDKEKFEIRQRCQLLCHAYVLAKEHMNDWKWMQCCDTACRQLNPTGNISMRSGLGITTLHQQFRENEMYPMSPPEKKAKAVPKAVSLPLDPAVSLAIN